jgi:hypothetical protein
MFWPLAVGTLIASEKTDERMALVMVQQIQETSLHNLSINITTPNNARQLINVVGYLRHARTVTSKHAPTITQQ